jgi:hypothetical protein
MKLVIFSFLSFFVLATSVFAEGDEPKAPKSLSADEQKTLDDKRKRIEEKKIDLNGSEWALTVSPADPALKPIEDTFTFQDGQFKSTSLAKRGFNPTNYTINIPSLDAETAVWETMQTGKEGLVFIRGEWAGEQMTGRWVEQLDGGKKVLEAHFATASRKAIPTSSKEEEKPKEEVSADKSAHKSLVSKEKKPFVAAFKSGTTDEISDSSTSKQ